MILRASKTIPAMVAVTCALIAVTPAGATSVAIGASKDNTLYGEPSGLLSNGAGQRLFAGITGSSEIRRGLIEFDIASSIPAGAVIYGVTLTLNCSNAAVPTALPVTLNRVLAEWGEGTSVAAGGEGIGGVSTTGDATWIHTFYNSAFWSTAGGDFDAPISASQLIAGIGSYSWTSAAMAADVQDWLDDDSSNHGWILRGIEDSISAKRFDSRNHANASVRPVLTIDYTIPEPATLGLLASALLMARRRIR